MSAMGRKPSVAVADVAEFHFSRDNAFVDTERLAAVNADRDGRAPIDWSWLPSPLLLGAVPLLKFLIGERHSIAPLS